MKELIYFSSSSVDLNLLVSFLLLEVWCGICTKMAQSTKGVSRWSVYRQAKRAYEADIRMLNNALSSSQCKNGPMLTTEFASDDSYLLREPSVSSDNDPKDLNPEWSGGSLEFSDIQFNDASSYNSDDYISISDSEKSNLDDSDSDNYCRSNDLADSLAKWSVDFKISVSAVGSLLSILRPYHNDLPKDSRTLLGTQRTYDIQTITGGEYYHFGIEFGILEHFKRNGLHFDSKIELQCNIDGLPLFKSSSMQLWPILCCIDHVLIKDPFVVGIFCGNSKPKCLEEYLFKFVEEADELQKRGIYINGVHYVVGFSNFVCDAPARAFVKNVKSHSGYFGCDKCTQEGEWKDKITFPETNAILRTDLSFAERRQDEHHHGLSPLHRLNVGMVTQFPLDYMHLVCLGVVRRFLVVWMKGDLQIRLPAKKTQTISQRLLQVSAFVPREFARKPRSLSEMERWKATEFRQFLLYTGPVVLQNVLPDVLYNHFLLLFSAISILSTPQLCESVNNCNYANELLVTFVKDVHKIYGQSMLVYNVHSLVHLASDVARFGCLDNFSAFPFENKLQMIKSLVRKPQNSLAQLIRRLGERCKLKKHNIVPETNEFVASRPHTSGVCPPNLLVAQQYKQAKSKNMFLSLSDSDNTFLSENGIPAKVLNILSVNQNIVVVYEEYRSPSSLFEYPIKSSNLGIFKVSELSGVVRSMSAKDIKVKFVCLPCCNEVGSYIATPLLHYM